jgi:hypothetical protein
MIRVVHPGCRIPDPDADFFPSRIPDPGVKKHPIPDPGSGSATLELPGKNSLAEISVMVCNIVNSVILGPGSCDVRGNAAQLQRR